MTKEELDEQFEVYWTSVLSKMPERDREHFRDHPLYREISVAAFKAGVYFHVHAADDPVRKFRELMSGTSFGEADHDWPDLVG